MVVSTGGRIGQTMTVSTNIFLNFFFSPANKGAEKLNVTPNVSFLH